MDYAAPAGSNIASRPLEGLASMTQRVNTSAVLLNNFLDRFHGQIAPTTNETEAPPAGYADSLTRLSAAIDRLEKYVEAISHIG